MWGREKRMSKRIKKVKGKKKKNVEEERNISVWSGLEFGAYIKAREEKPTTSSVEASSSYSQLKENV